MDKEILDRLVGIVGERYASNEPTDLVCYSLDSYAIGKGILPDIVLRPKNTEEVSEIIKIADEHVIPVVPRGAGTCLTGGCVPTRHGIVIDLTRMNNIIDFRKEDMTVTVESGIVFADLNAALKKHGLFFPPDPASGEVCTIGGMVAENASGMRAVKYGTTSDYLLGLKVVLPDGRIAQIGNRAMKTASGYDLVHLFNRSEGTLGVITEITLRLRPLPRVVSAAVASFPSQETAGNTVSKVITTGVDVAAIELIDAISIQVMKEVAGLKLPDAEALLFLELHGEDQHDIDRSLSRFSEIAKTEGCTSIDYSDDEEEMERMWAGRRRLFATLVRLKPAPITTDIVVPLSKISAALSEIRRIGREVDLKIATYGHVGDGNIHSLILADPRVGGEIERAHQAHDAINRMALSLGGTITGEHGIGIEKKKITVEEHGEIGVELMNRIKKCIDPKGIMNPDKVFEVI